MTGKTLMVLGTMSSAGKSLLVTGLCRIFSRKRVRVAPYKSQNLSNNAAVCADGSEIGRAQYTQALASGIQPTAKNNPILVKPEAGSQSQIIVMGKPFAHLASKDYYQLKDELWGVATRALDDLRAEYDLVIMEGAGSPVELNLTRGDIVNMSVARYADAPVLLVGDIDRGGIFAQLLGTLWLLEPEERELVKGLIINKFRGDVGLFYDGVKILEDKGGIPVVGVVPFVHHRIPEEDAVAIEAHNLTPSAGGEFDIVVIRLPTISNFDDFDPLINEPDVRVRYAGLPGEVGRPVAIILPGSKSTMADLKFLRDTGLFEHIQDYQQGGGAVVGICGGYQMLGTTISDPAAVESSENDMEGLGLLPVETIYQEEKATHQVRATIHSGRGWLSGIQHTAITGYEIHMGVTRLQEASSWLTIDRRSGEDVSVTDGAVSEDGKVWGCYIHGIFENCDLRRAWLKSLGWRPQAGGADVDIQVALDELADAMEAALDMTYLYDLLDL
jgi:adenosylcobyric acid synthase